MRAATLRKSSVAVSGGLDAWGDPITTTAATYACEGFTEAYSDFYRTQAGIPVEDIQINIFAASLTTAGIRPDKDDQVLITGVMVDAETWYQLRAVKTDPATALWVCQAFEIPDPT